MKIIVDESVSFGVVSCLREEGHEVTSIAETGSGLNDSEVFEIVKKEKAVFITRDHHFTNIIRFPSTETFCIIFIRKGNLTSGEEIELIKSFFKTVQIADFSGSLITLSKNHIKVR